MRPLLIVFLMSLLLHRNLLAVAYGDVSNQSSPCSITFAWPALSVVIVRDLAKMYPRRTPPPSCNSGMVGI